MAKLANVERYLSGLPNGVASHSQCVQKASVLVQYLKGVPDLVLPDDVPLGARELASHPPVASVWVHVPLVACVVLAIRDLHFSDDDKFLEFCHAQQRALYRGPLYRALFLFVSPKQMIAGIDERWRRFHRGSEIAIVGPIEDRHVQLRLTYPEALFTPLYARVLAGACASGVEAAWGQAVKTHMLSYTSTAAEFEISWA